jgi:hypothetical protein
MMVEATTNQSSKLEELANNVLQSCKHLLKKVFPTQNNNSNMHVNLTEKKTCNTKARCSIEKK